MKLRVAGHFSWFGPSHVAWPFASDRISTCIEPSSLSDPGDVRSTQIWVAGGPGPRAMWFNADLGAPGPDFRTRESTTLNPYSPDIAIGGWPGSPGRCTFNADLGAPGPDFRTRESTTLNPYSPDITIAPATGFPAGTSSTSDSISTAADNNGRVARVSGAMCVQRKFGCPGSGFSDPGFYDSQSLFSRHRNNTRDSRHNHPSQTVLK